MPARNRPSWNRFVRPPARRLRDNQVFGGRSDVLNPPSSLAELRAYYDSLYEKTVGKWFDFEAIIQRAYEALLKPGDIAIDGGAHLGAHTIPMARKVAPEGKVYAFEPIHELVKRLRERIRSECPELTGVIRIHEIAISDHGGIDEFLVAADPAYSGLRERVYPHEMPLDRRKVLVDTLDNFIPFSPVRFIKLDLEGGEFHALKGARNLLKRERPAIVFEYDRFNTPRFYNYEHAELLDFWDSLNYQILDIIGTPFDQPELWQAATLWYYFALPREADLAGTIQSAARACIPL